jgi:hypothetical protein
LLFFFYQIREERTTSCRMTAVFFFSISVAVPFIWKLSCLFINWKSAMSWRMLANLAVTRMLKLIAVKMLKLKGTDILI